MALIWPFLIVALSLRACCPIDQGNEQCEDCTGSDRTSSHNDALTHLGSIGRISIPPHAIYRHGRTTFYTIVVSLPGDRSLVQASRRYNEFKKLRDELTLIPFDVVFPSRQLSDWACTWLKSLQSCVEDRRLGLEAYLNRALSQLTQTADEAKYFQVRIFTQFLNVTHPVAVPATNATKPHEELETTPAAQPVTGQATNAMNTIHSYDEAETDDITQPIARPRKTTDGMNANQRHKKPQTHADLGANPWNPEALCDGVRAEERAQFLIRNQKMTHGSAVQQVMDEFARCHMSRNVVPSKSAWNPDVMCGNIRAGERAQWLMNEAGMTQDVARAKVMKEFPEEFSSQQNPPSLIWDPTAMCGSSRASERVAWLMANHGLIESAAQAIVMQEFPTQFSGSRVRFNPDAICGDATAEARVQWLLKNIGLSRELAEERVMSEFPDMFTRTSLEATPPVPLAAPQDTWGSSMLAPIRTDVPPFPVITHPERPLHISQDFLDKPIPTNKFMGNLLVGDANQPIWTHPYIVRPKASEPYGLSMCAAPEKVFGGSLGENRSQFYYNVVVEEKGAALFGLGASEFSSEPSREIVSIDELGVGFELRFEGGGAGGRLTTPLVRGMAYGTFEYDALTPVVFTNQAIVDVNGQQISDCPQSVALPRANKFSVQLKNGDTWLLYSLNGKIGFTLHCRANGQSTQWELASQNQFSGTLRCAMLPAGADSTVLGSHVNTIPIGCALETSTSGYSLNWHTRGGEENQLLHYTMLHHRLGISHATPTKLNISSTTKGTMVAYIGSKWQFDLDLPSIDWLPPQAPMRSKLELIRSALESDVAKFSPASVDKPENYFAGKALHKYALLVLVADYLAETKLKNSCLEKLKIAIQTFISGKNRNPLRYDRTWKGVVGGVSGSNKLFDFGSFYYNDHHYHWGYFIQTAAIIARFDSAWASQHRGWVEALIRDVSNPSLEDPYFPTWRNFDWYSGHSWSQGIFESVDGKDQESTSEEINYHYGVMLWGMAVGSRQLEQLGRLMTSVATRSIQTYFLMDSDSEAHPPTFRSNKVTGIFFENKVDYTTWFGSTLDKIHGIQMLPFTAMTEYVRTPKFVAEEWPLLDWTAKRSQDGWRSVLWMNYAIIDPEVAFTELKSAVLDDGLTRTWALFWAATRKSS